MSRISELIQQRDALAAQQAALDKALRELQGAERQAAIEKVRALMAEHGITAADLNVTESRKKARGRPPKGTDGRSASAGKPVAAKYRNTATGETWSGRGLKPKWLSAAIGGGAKLEDFLIAAA
jgi:DNA-binding protein H-NS